MDLHQNPIDPLSKKTYWPYVTDLHDVFSMGDDKTLIASIDANGVALAAIKALQEVNEEQNEIISIQQEEIKILKKEIEQLKSLFKKSIGAKRKN